MSLGRSGSARRWAAVGGPAQDWLRVYARYLEDPPSTEKDWDRLAEAEAEALQLRPDKIRLALLRDFLRWQVDLWERQGRRDKAIAIMRRTLDLQQASRVDLLDTADWLLRRSAWPLIDALAEQFSEAFDQDPHLLYRRAESFRRQGQTAAAEKLAAQAQAQVVEEPFLHVELGRELQKRGFVDWAEQEYRQTLQSFEEGTHPNLEARIRLGWLLHDWSRYEESYTVLLEVVRQMDRDTGARSSPSGTPTRSGAHPRTDVPLPSERFSRQETV